MVQGILLAAVQNQIFHKKLKKVEKEDQVRHLAKQKEP